MVWSWKHSTSPEYNETLLERLKQKDGEWLAKAIADNNYERIVEGKGPYGDEEYKGVETGPGCFESETDWIEIFKKYEHGYLVNMAHEIALENDNCDNGAWRVWIDWEGYWKIDMRDDK